jgi:amino acid adenylation domain-containing protein
MNLIHKFYHSFKKYSTNRAFCIGGKDISYGEFLEYINGARKLIDSKINKKGIPVGIICFDNIETYAAIFATWFSGNYFIPINPKHPCARNNLMIENTGIKNIFSVINEVENIICTDDIQLLNNLGQKIIQSSLPIETEPEQLMYVLTTSGSTGVPKYVPINEKNVDAYCTGFLNLYPNLKPTVNFLQTYDLTSDAAFTGYLLPLLIGASVFTVPNDSFKFLSIAKLISNKQITWVKLTPSVLNYLTPYIPKLELKHIEHVIFGGEALQLSLLKKWQGVFQGAEFSNLYGPTETTISATAYRFSNIENAKSRNGVISIGKPFPEVECAVIDKNSNVLGVKKEGNLCIGGNQTMKGYLKKGEKSGFVELNLNNKKLKFYITGDIVTEDKNGYYYFLGRIDDQVKIEGYRVNLIEVEKSVRNIIPDYNIFVIAHEKLEGLKRLYVFIEGFRGEFAEIKQKLEKQLPGHMVPDEIFAVPEFPFTSSGKIDKTELKNKYLLNLK